MNNIDCKLLELTKSSLSQTLLYGNTLFDKTKNTLILNATTEYVLSTERFEETQMETMFYPLKDLRRLNLVNFHRNH